MFVTNSRMFDVNVLHRYETVNADAALLCSKLFYHQLIGSISTLPFACLFNLQVQNIWTVKICELWLLWLFLLHRWQSNNNVKAHIRGWAAIHIFIYLTVIWMEYSKFDVVYSIFVCFVLLCFPYLRWGVHTHIKYASKTRKTKIKRAVNYVWTTASNHSSFSCMMTIIFQTIIKYL